MNHHADDSKHRTWSLVFIEQDSAVDEDVNQIWNGDDRRHEHWWNEIDNLEGMNPSLRCILSPALYSAPWQ